MGGYKNKCVCFQNFKEIKPLYPCYPGKERVSGLAKQNKLKQDSEGKKKIGTSLKQQGGCFSAIDRPMMGKSEAFSVHI